jgi:uncharacterized protein YodC (DUF2158 family)
LHVFLGEQVPLGSAVDIDVAQERFIVHGARLHRLEIAVADTRCRALPMSNEIKIGSVVTLKSGSGRMTVNHIEGDNVHCVWFPFAAGEYAPETRRDVFPRDALVHKVGNE